MLMEMLLTYIFVQFVIQQFNLFYVKNKKKKKQPLLLHKLMKVRLEPHSINLRNNNEDD